MSHFYANIQGSRGEATRQGTKNSGMFGHIRGWDIGAQVRCWVDESGKDIVEIYVTGGSNGCHSPQLMGRFSRNAVGELKSEQ